MAKVQERACPTCTVSFYASNGRANLATKTGAPLYCSVTCASKARRVNNPKSPRNPNWPTLKAAYDRDYRRKNKDVLKEKKAAAYAIYGPNNREKEKAVRAERMPLHIEYCRRPDYRAKKSAYDRVHLAKKQFGVFAEAALILRDIEYEVSERATRYDIYTANGTLNKNQTRRREYERTTGKTQRN